MSFARGLQRSVTAKIKMVHYKEWQSGRRQELSKTLVLKLDNLQLTRLKNMPTWFIINFIIIIIINYNTFPNERGLQRNFNF